MFWAGKIFFVFGALLVLQSAYALIDGFRFLGLIRRRLEKPLAPDLPPATVLIPCKGVDVGFEANVEAFLRQDYPQYQIVFIVASENDAALSNLKFQIERSTAREPAKPATQIIVAGIAEGRGEKVHNLLRGLEAVDPAAAVLVFADIDATPHADWLRSLVARLHDPQVTVSTGFRWYLPANGFASHLRAAWDTSIATMLGERGVKFAWGGSMAIRAADFRRLRVAEDY